MGGKVVAEAVAVKSCRPVDDIGGECRTARQTADAWCETTYIGYIRPDVALTVQAFFCGLCHLLKPCRKNAHGRARETQVKAGSAQQRLRRHSALRHEGQRRISDGFTVSSWA